MPFSSILFLCVANSARSQMAEGLGRKIFAPGVAIQSAGSEPSTLNPYAVRVMGELGIDISKQYSKFVASVPSKDIDLVITLCAEEVCPVFLGASRRMHWPLPDPDRKDEQLSDQAHLEAFRQVRDELQQRLETLRDSIAG